MSKISYNGIRQVGTTFRASNALKTLIEANKYSDNAIVRDICIAVKLSDVDGVTYADLGGAVPTAADAIFGVAVYYDLDGVVTVQDGGYVSGVPAASAVTVGAKTIAVNDKGQISSVASTVSDVTVIEYDSTGKVATLKI